MTKTKAFTGIPLECQILAAAFDEVFKIFYQSVDFATVIRFEIIFLSQQDVFVRGNMISIQGNILSSQ